MKKIIILSIAVLASLVIASCVKEINPNESNVVIDKNDIAFVIRSTPGTRSAEEVSVNSFEVPVPSIRKTIYFDEEVSTIDAVVKKGPATRGTPAYTENVASLYGEFNMNAFAIPSAATETLTPMVIEDGAAQVQSDNTTWLRQFDADPWGNYEQLYFFMRMPVDQPGVDSYTYGYDGSKGTIKFAYRSPALATNQADILYSARPIVKEEAKGTTIPVFFHHALTAVKFRMGNELDLTDSKKTRTYITKVEFIGLRNSGTCTITPTPENDSYTDTDTYSSQNVVSWSFSDEDTRTTRTNTIYQSFGDDDLVDYTGGTKFPESFYDYNTTVGDKDGLDKNLNDEDASMTFWLIPQIIDENVRVLVTVKVVADGDVNMGPNGTGNECILELGTILNGQEWKAGQMRTFTIKPDVVGITIDDEMTNNSTVKEKVVIKNLGNVREYVRVNIVANWVGTRATGIDSQGQLVYEDHETVLFGFQSDATDASGNYTDDTEVLAWNDKDPEYKFLDGTTVTESSGTLYKRAGIDYRRYGTFVGLPTLSYSYDDPSEWDADNGWVRFDKYYYYIDPIGPGESVYPTTAPLFESYTVNPSPLYFIADEFGIRRQAKDVHLVMDVLVQAIKVPVDTDGEELDFISAWKDALAPNNNLDDL